MHVRASVCVYIHIMCLFVASYQIFSHAFCRQTVSTLHSRFENVRANQSTVGEHTSSHNLKTSSSHLIPSAFDMANNLFVFFHWMWIPHHGFLFYMLSPYCAALSLQIETSRAIPIFIRIRNEIPFHFMISHFISRKSMTLCIPRQMRRNALAFACRNIYAQRVNFTRI